MSSLLRQPAGTLARVDEVVRSYALAEKADATRRAYHADFCLFSAWCRDRGGSPLGAPPELVAAFLAAQADTGKRPSTLTRRLAAIGYAHKLAGLPSPAAHEAVRAVMRGIRRVEGAAPRQKAPATAERVAAMLAAIPGATLTGKRDRALLLLGFAGAFRRAELVALEAADLTFEADGLRIKISKADQETRRAGGRRSPSRMAPGCAPSPPSRTGWRRPRSRTGACSAASTGMGGCWGR
jgi:site-specific recombinase XerD